MGLPYLFLVGQYFCLTYVRTNAFADYYRQELTKKIERGINMSEPKTATQLLEEIVSSINEFFENEIRVCENEIDEKWEDK